MFLDGFPVLIRCFGISNPSVPAEKEHASCERELLKFPCMPEVPRDLLFRTNSVWNGESPYVKYSTESDIAGLVKLFLRDIAVALKVELEFSSEITINVIRPDISVLLMGKFLVGVLEVKKPGGSILEQPTVLGELLDQMILVGGFYGTGPVIGILTTAEEWLMSWFPADTATFVRRGLPNASFSTPFKPIASTGATNASTYSPPGGTPSQISGAIHKIDTFRDDMIDDDTDDTDGFNLLADNVDKDTEIVRVLNTTEIVNIHTNYDLVLQLLCSAIQLMATSCTNYSEAVPRCLLKFHKDSKSVSFNSHPYAKVMSSLNFDKFPRPNVKTLVAVEDLGRGETGKAWLCATLNKAGSAVCVLKFGNKNVNREKLDKERLIWELLYPQFSVRVEIWSGAAALVMPHLATVLKEEREEHRDKVAKALTDIVEKGKVHNDVRWPNIGKYSADDGKIVIVLFDFDNMSDYNAANHSNWINDSMTSLYGESGGKREMSEEGDGLNNSFRKKLFVPI